MLPIEIILRIAYYLTPADILNLGCSCKNFKPVIYDYKLWIDLAYEDFNFPKDKFMTASSPMHRYRQIEKALSIQAKGNEFREGRSPILNIIATKDTRLYKAIEADDTDSVAILLHYETPNIYMLERAMIKGQSNIIQMLLYDHRLDVSDNYKSNVINFYGLHPNALKIILKDARFDPTISNNLFIKYLWAVNNKENVSILLRDERVRNSLSELELKMFEDGLHPIIDD